MRQGKVPHEDYRVIEDAAVDPALRLQENAGLKVPPRSKPPKIERSPIKRRPTS
jgi:methionine synthase II (cobalamin-independent)